MASMPADAAAKGSGAARLRRPRQTLAYWFFFPSLALVILVYILPTLHVIRQSLHQTTYLTTGPFVGLKNYGTFFAGPGFGYLRKSLVYTVGTLLFSLPLGTSFALLLNRELRFGGVYRTILIMPWFVSQLITGMLLVWLLNARFGPVSYLFSSIGLGFPDVITDTRYAMAALVQANTWRSFPLIMVFVLAGLQAIPRGILESAQIDGAGPWLTLWKITVPLLKNTFLVSIVLTSLNTIEMVTLILIMTGGGPAGVTDVLALQVFKEAFLFNHADMASVAAVVIFMVNIFFTLGYLWILRMGKES
jgi:multiple sugar transport system permease protein